MIEARGLTKTFGKIVAVDNVSFSVDRHEIFGVVGPDGAGKTTLLRMACGLMEPERGRITLFGQDPASELNKSRLGYMPQRFSLYGDLTVMENLNFFGGLYGLNKAIIRRRAGEILAITNMQPFSSRLADNLSGGMKQKLSLTCALITRPELLVLDEPTYGVDPESRKEFWKIIYRLNQDGITVVVTTPYMDEAELCHRVAIMNKGRVVAVDSPVNLKRKVTYPLLEVKADTRNPSILQGLKGIVDYSFYGDRFHVAVDDMPAAANIIREHLAGLQIRLYSLQEVQPSMEDVFVALTGTENGVKP